MASDFLPTHSGLRLDQLLTRYKAWADNLTYSMIVQQPPEELIKERATTFKTINHTLHHIYIVDAIFRAHIEGREHDYTARTMETPPSIEELRNNVNAMNRWWIDLSDKVSATTLADSIEFQFINGDHGKMSLQEIILHIVQHASYHRGYVDDMMYQIPITPPATDLTVFLQRGSAIYDQTS